MNKIQQKIYDDIVKPSLDDIAGMLVATVINFNNVRQTGTVEMKTSRSVDDELMYNVPLLNIGGIKQSAPFPGDRVFLYFLNGSHLHPVIIGKADSKHFAFTRNDKESHFRSGSNVTDMYSDRDGEEWDD